MIDRRTSSVLFTILVFAFTIAIIYRARRPLLMLVFGILFAYLLEPLVGHFQVLLRGSRKGAIALTFAILVTAVSIFFATAGPKIVDEGKKLGQEFPTLMENVGTGRIAQQIGSRQGWSYETQIKVQQFLSDHREQFRDYIQTAGTRAAGFAGDLVWLLLIPVFAIFVLLGKNEFAATMLSLANGYRDRRFVYAVITDLDVMLASFIRAQLTLAALSLVAYTMFLVIARFPFAFPIAAISGSLEFIPLVGPFASAGLIIGMAVLTGYKHWLIVLIFLGLWRGMQDYVNSPLLMGRGLKLHPFAVILGVLIGGDVAGIAGIFLSVPVMATLRIIWKNWRLRQSGGEPHSSDVTPTVAVR